MNENKLKQQLIFFNFIQFIIFIVLLIGFIFVLSMLSKIDEKVQKYDNINNNIVQINNKLQTIIDQNLLIIDEFSKEDKMPDLVPPIGYDWSGNPIWDSEEDAIRWYEYYGYPKNDSLNTQDPWNTPYNP